MPLPRTKKVDWLTNAFSERGCYVSGAPKTAERLDLEGNVTLRFIGHFPDDEQPPQDMPVEQRAQWLPSRYHVMMGFLVIGREESPASFQPSPIALEYLRRLEAQYGTPMAMVAFKESVTDSDLFWVKDPELEVEGTISPAEYARVINARRKPVTWESPQPKPFNKSSNDWFQDWTSACLTRQCVVNDLDIVQRIEKEPESSLPLLLELKRSGYPFNSWKPYVDDVPNYLLLRTLSQRRRRAIDLTLHYHECEEGTLGLHVITRISRSGISGYRKVFQAERGARVVQELTEWISLHGATLSRVIRPDAGEQERREARNHLLRGNRSPGCLQ